MKVVFIDFDGVLNRGSGAFLIEPVTNLNRVTNLTGAVIVIHSSWRYGRTVDELREMVDFWADYDCLDLGAAICIPDVLAVADMDIATPPAVAWVGPLHQAP